MLELNQPIQNPALIKVMDAFKKEPSPRTELDMIAGLLSAKFLTPISLAKPVVAVSWVRTPLFNTT